MRPDRVSARIVATGLACCAGAVAAQVDGGEVELTQAMAAPLAATTPITTAATLQTTAPHATQTMLWRRRGALAFGVGVEHAGAAAPAGPGLQPRGDTLLVGFSLATSEHTSLSWQTAADNAGTPFAQRPMKVALTFRRTDTVQHLRRGSLLRMELSGQTTLALRARGGKLGLALTSRW